METQSKYKEALEAYRKGFLVGLFTGVVLMLMIGKLVFILPIVLSLLFGAIAFDRKINEHGNE
jgi:membrane glycosyltransferase